MGGNPWKCLLRTFAYASVFQEVFRKTVNDDLLFAFSSLKPLCGFNKMVCENELRGGE